MVPGTFARSLSARSPVDQGIVTGLSTGLHYLLTVGTQDTLQAVAAELVAAAANRRGSADRGRRQRRLTLAADLAAIPLGLAVQSGAAGAARRADAARGAPPGRVAARPSTGIGGSLLIGSRDRRCGRGRAGWAAGGRIARLPVAVPVGLAVALRPGTPPARDQEARPTTEPAEPGRGRVRGRSAIAGGVVGGLAVAATPSTPLASTAGRGWPRCCPAARSCGS